MVKPVILRDKTKRKQSRAVRQVFRQKAAYLNLQIYELLFVSYNKFIRISRGVMV